MKDAIILVFANKQDLPNGMIELLLMCIVINFHHIWLAVAEL